MSEFLHRELTLPPEQILRGYLHLTHVVFVMLRGSGVRGDLQAKFVYDLADAMHNIAHQIAFFGDSPWDEEQFRAIYLRPFDQQWRCKGLTGWSLEEELTEFYRGAGASDASERS